MNLKTQESDLNLIHKHNYRTNCDDSTNAQDKEYTENVYRITEVTSKNLLKKI